MITDLFKDCFCRCGNTNGFVRLVILDLAYGTDYLYKCIDCETLFIRTYSRDIGHKERRRK